MADSPCIILKSNEQGRSFTVRKDRLVKISYFESLLGSAWADADASTFQIEPSIKFLTYKIEKLLFVDYIESDWTIPPFESSRSHSVSDDKVKASRKNEYSYHGALPPMKPPWLASAAAKHSIRDLVTLYRLADFYDIADLAIAVEVLVCARWHVFQQEFGIHGPVSRDGIAQLTAFVKASKVLPQRGLLLWIMASILTGYTLVGARLPWIISFAVPHFKMNRAILATVLTLPAKQSDYILHTIKQISKTFDYDRELGNDEHELTVRLHCAPKLREAREEPLLDCLVDAHNRHMECDRLDAPQVNRTCIDLINQEIDNSVARHDLAPGSHGTYSVRAILLGPYDLNILTHIGGRQLAWLVNSSFKEGLQYWFNHKLEFLTLVRVRLKRLWPSLHLNGELRVLDANEFKRLEHFVHERDSFMEDQQHLEPR